MTMSHPVRTVQMQRGQMERSQVTPREVRLTGAGVALITAAVAFGIGAIASAFVLFVAYTQAPGRFPIGIMVLIPISLLVLTVVMGRSVRRQWTLLSEGRIAQARVTKHQRIRLGEQNGYRVSCEFHDLSGAVHTARYDTRKNPPPAGAVVPIVYHRDNSNWSAFYPLRLVTPTRERRGSLDTGRGVR
jgi:hypothetical protein